MIVCQQSTWVKAAGVDMQICHRFGQTDLGAHTIKTGDGTACVARCVLQDVFLSHTLVNLLSAMPLSSDDIRDVLNVDHTLYNPTASVYS